MLEMVERRFTTQATAEIAPPPPEKRKKAPVYCLCRKPSSADMVKCDNDYCVNECFHTKCVRLSVLPEEDELWYCRGCKI